MVLLVSMAAHSAAVIESPKEDGLFYYKIGGARHITIPPSLTIETLNLSLNAKASALNCGAFDPALSIKHSLDNIKNGADNALNALQNAAGAAISNLPGYLLQKANPGLYDLFQNGLLRAQASFSLATKSCERMQYEISQSLNPYAEWVTLSRGDSWKKSLSFGEKNIHEAVDAARRGHNEGVTWIGGVKRGGVNQEPIRVVAEVAGAGLNMLSLLPPERTGDLPDDSPLSLHFENVDAVSQWVNEVLGDIQIGVCDACQKGTQPGRGLIPTIEQTADTVAQALTAIVQNRVPPTPENLTTVSAPGIVLTAQVIRAIQNLPSVERGIVVQKLSQDIAEAQVMEKAMLVRRFLLTGVKEAHVVAIKMAVKEVERAVEALDEEIRNVIFEKDIRTHLVTQTVMDLLIKDAAMRSASITVPALSPNDETPLKRGAVKP
ncbi:integrating conjugative element protein [Alteromonadaceae bacterium M269]|nr:integrating conjugative element protein [Alteromonadaceae bacterium M269]